MSRISTLTMVCVSAMGMEMDKAATIVWKRGSYKKGFSESVYLRYF